MPDADDVIFEPETEEEGGTTAEALKKKLAKTKEELAQANREKQQYLEGWQRAKADYVNAKKRSEEERVSQALYAAEKLLISLLPVLDSFDHALASAEGDEPWLAGIQNTHAQLLSALATNGVESFSPLGEIFDPVREEAVETLAVRSPEEDNTVTKVHQKGYVLRGKVIRPARVAIGHYEG
ncbi:MAG: nucleotide exchange factor GrpE, partial [Patescibacteria group bacterium]|nr:nucleotide exchange factor GrpE [Patescibacteria group bacterium]